MDAKELFKDLQKINACLYFLKVIKLKEIKENKDIVKSIDLINKVKKKYLGEYLLLD